MRTASIVAGIFASAEIAKYASPLAISPVRNWDIRKGLTFYLLSPRTAIKHAPMCKMENHYANEMNMGLSAGGIEISVGSNNVCMNHRLHLLITNSGLVSALLEDIRCMPQQGHQE
jgi:hypothetical protein